MPIKWLLLHGPNKQDEWPIFWHHRVRWCHPLFLCRGGIFNFSLPQKKLFYRKKKFFHCTWEKEKILRKNGKVKNFTQTPLTFLLKIFFFSSNNNTTTLSKQHNVIPFLSCKKSITTHTPSSPHHFLFFSLYLFYCFCSCVLFLGV